jgi:hypothetical protein
MRIEYLGRREGKTHTSFMFRVRGTLYLTVRRFLDGRRDVVSPRGGRIVLSGGVRKGLLKLAARSR